jgi:hypothetical protein
MTDLSKKSVVTLDRGLFPPFSRRLGRDFKDSYYYLAEEKTSPSYDNDCIGKGFKDMTVVDEFEKYLEIADMVAFTDVYNGGKPEWLVSHGYNVFSAMKSEILETDRKKLRKVLELAKLPVTPAVEVELGKLQKYLKDKKDKYLKASFYRDDMETEHYEDAFLSSWWFEKMRTKLGMGYDTFKVLVEDPIPSDCEGGYDTPMLNGDLPKNPMIGYEKKGEAYLSCIVEELPPPYALVHKKMKPAFKTYGYQSWYSNEMRRHNDSGLWHVTDVTTRLGGPPSELYEEQYEDFSLAVWMLAHGKMPTLTVKKKYGALLNFWSKVGIKHWLPVQYPDDIDWAVKLKNVQKVDGGYYVIPKDADGDTGSVIGMGDTTEEAIAQCMENFEKIKAPHMESGGIHAFEEIQETIKKGESYGINWK